MVPCSKGSAGLLPTPGDLKSAPLRQGRPQMGSCNHTSAKADLPQAVALAQPPLLLDVAPGCTHVDAAEVLPKRCSVARDGAT